MNEFAILDKTLESSLALIREKTDNGNLEMEQIFDTDIPKENIDQLVSNGFITVYDASNYAQHSWLVSLTYNGKNYEWLKEQYKERTRKSCTVDWVRYGITTLIAIAALIVAILALNK